MFWVKTVFTKRRLLIGENCPFVLAFPSIDMLIAAGLSRFSNMTINSMSGHMFSACEKSVLRYKLSVHTVWTFYNVQGCTGRCRRIGYLHSESVGTGLFKSRFGACWKFIDFRVKSQTVFFFQSRVLLPQVLSRRSPLFPKPAASTASAQYQALSGDVFAVPNPFED